eukprot:SAG11_NODE_29153_length_314_cov_0.679070_1_plen_86_part_01
MIQLLPRHAGVLLHLPLLRLPHIYLPLHLPLLRLPRIYLPLRLPRIYLLLHEHLGDQEQLHPQRVIPCLCRDGEHWLCPSFWHQPH